MLYKYGELTRNFYRVVPIFIGLYILEALLKKQINSLALVGYEMTIYAL